MEMKNHHYKWRTKMDIYNGHIKWTYKIVHIWTLKSKLHFEWSIDASIKKWTQKMDQKATPSLMA